MGDGGGSGGGIGDHGVVAGVVVVGMKRYVLPVVGSTSVRILGYIKRDCIFVLRSSSSFNRCSCAASCRCFLASLSRAKSLNLFLASGVGSEMKGRCRCLRSSSSCRRCSMIIRCCSFHSALSRNLCASTSAASRSLCASTSAVSRNLRASASALALSRDLCTSASASALSRDHCVSAHSRDLCASALARDLCASASATEAPVLLGSLTSTGLVNRDDGTTVRVGAAEEIGTDVPDRLTGGVNGIGSAENRDVRTGGRMGGVDNSDGGVVDDDGGSSVNNDNGDTSTAAVRSASPPF